MVTVLAFVTLNEANPWALAEYFRIIGPVSQRAGARIVKRFSIVEPVLGRPPFSTLIIVEYPDRASYEAVIASDEYLQAIPMRELAFSSYSATIVDDPVKVVAPGQSGIQIT
jgi:uncharacterized protein (DUF1330 family)